MKRKAEKKFSEIVSKDFGGSMKLLRAVCSSFERGTEGKKAGLLHSLSSFGSNHPGALIEYHQLLLFLCAYPQSKNLLTLANKELQRVAIITGNIFEGKSERQRLRLVNTGIVNTRVNVSFSFHLVKWLLKEFTGEVELFSIDTDEATAEQVLCACLPPIERDIIADRMLKTLPMIQHLKGKGQTELEFLVQLFDSAEIPGEARDVMWDSLKIFITWKINAAAPSLTEGRSPARKIFFHKHPLLKIFDWRKVIKEPMGGPRQLNGEEKRNVVTVGRGVLAMALRETDPVTYANEEEVTLFDMGRGIDVALFPMIPERRLPLEAYIGYVAFKNRIPVAYGGGWIFLHRSKIGVNVFPAFRGGESALLFCQILRAYHHHYHVKKFIVEPYQIGKNNMEGLKSGAFWFYYRLGFIPENETLKTLAQNEFEKISLDKNYRSPLTLMKKLANSNLELDLSHDKNYPDADPQKISEALNRYINTRFQGNRSKANEWAMAQLFSITDISDLLAREIGEMKAFNDLSLTICVLNDLAKLSEKEQHNLVKLMLLKGAKQERDFILFSQRHWKFFTNKERLS